jgi:DNA topoisomerase IA
MRTDSVNFQAWLLTATKQKIIELHGEKYVKIRKYQTKSKGAQEAHEAIRPTYMNKRNHFRHQPGTKAYTNYMEAYNGFTNGRC